MPDTQIWSGHVLIYQNEKGEKCIRYKADGAESGAVYMPDGWFEKKAVNGLVDKLKS